MASSTAPSKFVNAVVESSNKFALDLFKIIGSGEENCFFSPFSIYIALVLTYIGAAGKTAAELIESLHLPENKDEFLQGIRELLDAIKNPKLNAATEIFIEKTYKVKPSYIEAAKKFVDSESRLLDFKTAYAEAEKLINAWVSTQTKQKINDLLPSGTLSSDTRLVLVNAVHFKDDWMHQFKARNTRDDDFHLSKEKTIKVPMMSQTERFGYLKKDDFKILQLPYQDPNFSMVIILPEEIDGLKSVEKKLQSVNLNSLLAETKSCKVDVKLPKFKLEKFVDLTQILSQNGLNHMFTDDANFSEIFEPSEEPIKVDKVLHKAFVEVNEEGTEAAAATAVMCMPLCLRIEPKEPIHPFIVDRPFIYLILYRQTVLFWGRLKSFNE
ncbi:hypothetical protein V9T40_004738 [Parthenolecanium corni]|uniref:Serpin domain-containing protein n=1 Tax=Parthenolecanium corni TaxID=536013 RepID=A0AAN9TCX4_9HEMI